MIIEFGSNSKKLTKMPNFFFKSQKSAKSGKKCHKSGNLPKFDAKKTGSTFLNFDAKTIFKRLRLVFIKAPIF